MPLPWAWPPTAPSTSIVNLTGRTISIRITRRTTRFPSSICPSASTAVWRSRPPGARKPSASTRSIWRRMRASSSTTSGRTAPWWTYNRSGVPLIEIVSEPDMRSADEVIAYLEKLRLIIQYLGASDCKLQEGSMRADVNLSVREVGAEKFGTRTEMKNLNSFKAIAHAIDGERARQIELLEEGKAVIQETRRWDDNKEYSYAMRSKEDAQDYRYFPEPDLVPIVISDAWLEEIRSRQPELRTEKLARYKEAFDIPEYDAKILTESKHMADLFEETTAICGKPKKVSNWLMVETMRLMKEHEMEPEELDFAPVHLAKLIDLVDAGTINGTVAKEVFEKIFTEDVDPEKYVEEKGLKTVNDEGALRATIQEIVAANPKSVEDYHNGKEKALGFLVGQTMKAMKGKANPGMINQILKELL